MSGMVTVAVAGDVAEAQDIRGILARAGIDAQLEHAETEAGAAPLDGPCRVLVGELQREAALEALADADEDEDELD